jgi:hypothetical protein
MGSQIINSALSGYKTIKNQPSELKRLALNFCIFQHKSEKRRKYKEQECVLTFGGLSWLSRILNH